MRKARPIKWGDRDGWEIYCPGCHDRHILVDWNSNEMPNNPSFSPSLLVTYNGPDADTEGKPPARCHSFITAGRIQFLDDCTHALKGQTIDLPDVDVSLKPAKFQE